MGQNKVDTLSQSMVHSHIYFLYGIVNIYRINPINYTLSDQISNLSAKTEVSFTKIESSGFSSCLFYAIDSHLFIYVNVHGTPPTYLHQKQNKSKSDLPSFDIATDNQSVCHVFLSMVMGTLLLFSFSTSVLLLLPRQIKIRTIFGRLNGTAETSVRNTRLNLEVFDSLFTLFGPFTQNTEWI